MKLFGARWGTAAAGWSGGRRRLQSTEILPPGLVGLEDFARISSGNPRAFRRAGSFQWRHGGTCFARCAQKTATAGAPKCGVLAVRVNRDALETPVAGLECPSRRAVCADCNGDPCALLKVFFA